MELTHVYKADHKLRHFLPVPWVYRRHHHYGPFEWIFANSIVQLLAALSPEHIAPRKRM